MTTGHSRSSWALRAPTTTGFLLIRVCVVGALAALGGFVTLLLFAWRRAGSSGLGDYLSELGATSQPGAGLYRLAVLCVAAAAALAALAWRLRAPQAGAAAFLTLSAALFVVSATVPCADGCPIPIRDGLSTLPNFVHFGVSGTAFALAIAAMLAVGSADVQPGLRRLSMRAAQTAIGLYGVLATLMLIFGHGLINGLTERLLATVCLAWLAGGVCCLCVRPAADPRPD